MCLGIPGRVVARFEAMGQPMGKVDFGGVVKDVCLAYVPEIEVGQYTIVHVGFAIAVLDEQSAHETLELLRQMGVLEEELGPAAGGDRAEPSAAGATRRTPGSPGEEVGS